MKYALDTNIVTYYLKGNTDIISKVDAAALDDNIIIPPFVYYEIKKWLLANNSQSKLKAFDNLISKYGVDVIDKSIFDLSLSIYIKLRKSGITIDDGDILIAAYCIEKGYTLVTNNQKHYKDIENINIENWA